MQGKQEKSSYGFDKQRVKNNQIEHKAVRCIVMGRNIRTNARNLRGNSSKMRIIRSDPDSSGSARNFNVAHATKPGLEISGPRFNPRIQLSL